MKTQFPRRAALLLALLMTGCVFTPLQDWNWAVISVIAAAIGLAVVLISVAARARSSRTMQARESREKQAAALYDLGREFGDNGALEEAIGHLRALLREIDRKSDAATWWRIHNNLGNALQALGLRESKTKHLEESIEIFREALGERTRDRAPLAWAMTQNNLGAALQVLGERESGTSRLEEAVAAYRLALEVYETSDAPQYRDAARKNLVQTISLLNARRKPPGQS